MIKRIIIVGKGGSGKDHLRKELEKRGFKYCVSHTTRPTRQGEIDGKDYFFITEKQASSMIKSDEFYEYVVFNNWLYGTSKYEFFSSDLFIMTPSGLSKMNVSDRAESFVVFLDIDEETRRERLLQRNDADNVDRRLNADNTDFSDFVDYDFSLVDAYFENFDQIVEISGVKILNV